MNNFDNVLSAFSKSSIFTRHDTFSSEIEKLENGKTISNIKGVSAERILSGFEEKILSVELDGSIEDTIQLMKEVGGQRQKTLSLIDFKEFCLAAETKLGDMALKSAFLVKHEPENRYFHIAAVEDDKCALGVIAGNGNRFSAMLFIKLKV